MKETTDQQSNQPSEQTADKSADKEKLEKALHKVRIADRLRMFFLFAALLMVLFVFYGNKFAMETAWYPACRSGVYQVLSVVVLLMLFATLAKTFFAGVYNRILKKDKES